MNTNATGGYSGSVPGNIFYGTGISDGAGARIVTSVGSFVDGVSGTLTATSQCREGAGIAGMPTTNGDNSYERKVGGTQDTDDNATDFAGPKPGHPENLDFAPKVSSTSPANGATAVAVNANIAVNFSEPVTVAAGAFSIACTSTGAHAAVVGGGPTSFSLDPATDFANSETCTVTVIAANISDNDTDDPPDNMASNYVFGFATAAPADAAPTVVFRQPASASTFVAINATITVGFSESVSLSGSWFSIVCASSGSHTATVGSGGTNLYILDPDGDFANDESCTVTVFASQVTDLDSNDPPDNMSADDIWSFTTIAVATPIHDVQGASHSSPLIGSTVKNVPGVVTAKRSNGFYMQDPAPDVDDATSEAIFVFTGGVPSVTIGDGVNVRGVVQEFRPGGSSSTNLTTTELGGSPVIHVASGGNVLPPPVVIGVQRIPPTTVIENDATGDVETSGIFDPATDGIDFWESLEAMRVQLDDAVAVGPGANFGEIPVVVNGAGLRTARGGIVVSASDFNPERIILDDEIISTPKVNVADTFPGATIGVVDYSFGNFKLEVTQLPAPVSGALARETTTSAGTNQLAITTFNVENLSPNDPASKFAALAQQVVNNLRSPDIVAVEEIQDNNGATNDSVVDASQTLNMLVAAIAAVGGPSYQWREIDPVDDQDGGQPGGNIRQAFLFRTDRGLSFVDRPGGTSTSGISVVAGPGGPQLSASPGRIDPTNGAFTSSRKPLAGEFLYNAQRLFVVANHFNSKGGDQPLFGHLQPPTRSSEAQRGLQADVVAAFVENLLSVDAFAQIAVVGDLNDFEFSKAVNKLKAAGLVTLVETLGENERYTYVFDGNSQVLDHIMVSAGLFADLASFDSVHTNAEFADQISDHDPQAARFDLPVRSRALCQLTRTYVLEDGIANSLCVKLEAAERLSGRAKTNQVQAYVNELNAQRGKAISDADATTLIALAGLL